MEGAFTSSRGGALIEEDCKLGLRLNPTCIIS